jgi:sec-independent protein translocase protein TatB
MLDFSWSHILIVLIVALVVVGPKDLPRLMRIAGKWMRKARQTIGQFRKGFDDMARESELDELRKEIKSMRNEQPPAGKENQQREVKDKPEAIAAAGYKPVSHE